MKAVYSRDVRGKAEQKAAETFGFISGSRAVSGD
jgi:hypothetical protein